MEWNQLMYGPIYMKNSIILCIIHTIYKYSYSYSCIPNKHYTIKSISHNSTYIYVVICVMAIHKKALNVRCLNKYILAHKTTLYSHFDHIINNRKNEGKHFFAIVYIYMYIV